MRVGSLLALAVAALIAASSPVCEASFGPIIIHVPVVTQTGTWCCQWFELSPSSKPQRLDGRVDAAPIDYG